MRPGREKLSVTLIGQSAPLASTFAGHGLSELGCASSKCPIIIEFQSISAPFWLIGKGCEDQCLVCACVCLCVRVSWSEAFTAGGFECCSLLWCNTRATRKSELMNRKLLLMIVKTLLSPHVASGHLSDTGWTYSSRHTLTHHTR